MKNKYITLLLIFNMIIMMCGCENNSNEVNKDSEDITVNEEVVEKSSISLENSFWLNTNNKHEYYFYSRNLKTNFKEKTPEQFLYEGYYTLTTNEEEVTQFREFFDGSKDSLKEKFNKNKEEVKDGVEFGLAINTNEQESIIHEYYGLYTEDKILLAEVGSEDTVIILEKLK